jgi:predicted flap endonuclease-1-like 5' DNA nuclease
VLEMIEANWLAFALALLIGILVAVWLFGRAARTGRKRQHRPDVLDEGVAPAQRNQSLIDAPSVTAASFAGTGPDILGGLGEIVGVAAAEEAEDAVPSPPPAPVAAPPAPAPAPAAVGAGDDLRRIKGVGPKLAALLQGLGVTTYAQIAAWSEADIDRIDAQLGTFAGRIRRDSWVEQAKFLAADDTAGFEGRFGKL